MPSMLTHRVLGDDVLKELDPSITVMQCIDQAFEPYSIGTSGPDVFFFYAAFPWSNPKRSYEVAKYGSWIHREHGPDFFRNILPITKATLDPLQISYAAGVLLHWALDSKAHPYVYYRTGTGNSSNLPHRFFESQLDLGIIQWKGIDLRKFKTTEVTKYKEDTWYPMWQLYHEALKEIWGAELKPEEMKEAVHDFHAVEQWIYDPGHGKMHTIYDVEHLFHLDGQVSSMIIPKHLDPDWNVMNEDHREWHHPTTNEVHHESFKEIFAQAKELGKDILNTYNDYLDGKATLDDVMKYITGNFHTGLDEEDNMQYFDLVPTRVPKNLY